MRLDLLLRDGRIVTMDDARPTAHTVGVLHGRIVGFDDDVAGLPSAETVDLHGATVTPGFIDAHCHTTWFGLGLAETDLAGARGLDEVYALLAAAAADADAAGAGNAAAADRAAAADEAASGWLLATGFNQKDHGGLFPELSALDDATGGRPLFIRHVSGHMALANTAALKAAGVYAADHPDPAGGVICRRDDGTPTGLLEENAQRLLQDLILPRSTGAIVAALDRATRQYAREGITSFTEAGVGGGWIGHSPIELGAYRRARREGALHARAQLMPTLDLLHPASGHGDDRGAADGAGGELGPDHGGLGLDLGMASGFGDDFVSLGPVKVFMDGSLLSETAAVTGDYCGHPHGAGVASGADKLGGAPEPGATPANNGYFQAAPKELHRRILAASASGWSIAAHAIGDRAVDLAIDILAECRATFGEPVMPNRIEHCSITRPDQLPRIKAAGIAVTPQSSFFGPMGDQMAVSLGTERAAWGYRARSFLDAGILLAGSSDRPVADGDVLRGIQAFVDRKTATGRVFGAEAERITARQALSAYTVDAARATGSFPDKGSLEVGKLADFTVLSASPLTVPTAGISAISVLATIVGGTFTHNDLPEPRRSDERQSEERQPEQRRGTP